MPLKLVPRDGSSAWYIRGTVRGQRVFETTGTADREQAEAFRAKREAELFEQAVYGACAVVSFERAALSYLEFEERSAATLFHVGRLVRHFGKMKLAKIGQAEADDAVRRILAPDAAPASKARSIYTPLTAILTHAHKRGWCDKPCFDRPAPPRGKTRWITPAEAIRLVGAASPHLKPILLFIVCTGARVAEALELDWRDVDLQDAKAVLRDTKNGSDRPATLSIAAVTVLANLPGRDGMVFRRDDGEPYADKERLEGGQIKTAFATACRRAGLIKWEKVEQGREDGPCTFVRWVPTLTPHDLRHSWATWFYALTKDFMLLKHEGGWRTIGMVERYAHLMPSDLVGEISMVWGAHHPAIGALPSRSGRSPDPKKAAAIRRGGKKS